MEIFVFCECWVLDGCKAFCWMDAKRYVGWMQAFCFLLFLAQALLTVHCVPALFLYMCMCMVLYGSAKS